MVILTALAVAACGPADVSKREVPRLPHGAANPGPFGGSRFQAGEFVRTRIDNTSFFHQLPMGEARVDMFLPKHTPMRVIQAGETYAKIELDNGQIGYVQSIMLEPIASAPGVPQAPIAPTAPARPGNVPGLIDPELVVPVE